MTGQLPQYIVLGLLAFGGGGIGTVVTGQSTEVLEVEMRQVKEDLQRYHTEVQTLSTELERRIDRLERRHPDLP